MEQIREKNIPEKPFTIPVTRQGQDTTGHTFVHGRSLSWQFRYHSQDCGCLHCKNNCLKKHTIYCAVFWKDKKRGRRISPVEELQFLHKMLSLAPLVVRTNLDTVHDDLLQQCDKTLQHIQLYHRIHRLNHQVGLLYIKEANKKAQPEEIHTVLSAWEELSKIPSEHHATHKVIFSRPRWCSCNWGMHLKTGRSSAGVSRYHAIILSAL